MTWQHPQGSGSADPRMRFDDRDKLKVALPLTAFGSLSVSELTPKIQAKTVYHVSDILFAKEVTGSGSTGHANTMGSISTGTTIGSTAVINTRRFVSYNPGQGTLFMWTMLFETAGLAGTTQIGGAGGPEQGLFFGYNGADFGILRRSNTVDDWIPQADWNIDTMLDTGAGFGAGPSGQILDPTKGNVYQVQFQWLGFGTITFYIEDSETGDLVPVHRIKFSNKNVVPSVGNPSFPICLMVDNGTTTTDLIMRGSSFAAFIEGSEAHLGPPFAADAVANVNTTGHVIFGIRNETTFKGVTSQVLLHPSAMSVANGDNRQAVFDILLVPTADFTAGAFSSVNSDSAATVFVEGDTPVPAWAGTAHKPFTITIARESSEQLGRDLAEAVGASEIPPGMTMMVFARATATSADVNIAFNWEENQ